MSNFRKIVVVNKGKSKILLIKIFREATGAGLCEAKDWAEGSDFFGIPSGVLAHNLPVEDCDKTFARLDAIVKADNTRGSNDNNLAIGVLDHDDPFEFDPEFVKTPPTPKNMREQTGLSLSEIAHQRSLSVKENALADDIISALNAHPENVEMLRGMLKLAASAIRLAAQERIRFLP